MRCWADEAREQALQRFTIDPDARLLIMNDAPPEVRIAAFAGSGDADLGDALRAVRSARPHLALVVGDLGSSASIARRNVAALGRLEIPVLFVAGGGDLHPVIDAALEDAPRVIDASRFRAIRIGRIELVPVAGAPEGRYARHEDACGIAREDVERIADETGDAEEGITRYLVSWAAPSPASGLGGVDAGSPLIARIGRAVGARGAIYAWPRERAGLSSEDPMHVALRPIAGPWAARGDGARVAPGATLLRLGQDGLAVDDSP